jgi:DNA-binding NarL/FixJ family response regulator
MTRVLICDDQALVRAGFRKLLEAEPGMEVVGEAENGEQAVALAARRAPDIVLMDVRMPLMDGVEATRRILSASRAPRVLVLTTFDLDEYVYETLRAGASGFLLKDVSPECLIAAIETVMTGAALLDPAVTRRVVEGYVQGAPPARPPAALADLTQREREVLVLVARGLTNTEIAERLVVAEATVKTHVGNLLAKLDARDRVQLVITAYEAGLVVPV